MLEAKLYCDQHTLSYPVEVDEYFKHEAEMSEDELREEFLEVDIKDALTEYRDGSSEGYELNVSKLPKEVKTIRFYNSW